MAEPIFLKLKHLGDTVIDYIDLFDEGVYGADKLYLRGRYTTFAEVKSAIEQCLAIGSPTESPASESNKLAYNRFSQPDKLFFIPDLNDPYAMKAQFMLQFAIRVRLYNNFAYIHFGIPWARKWDSVNNCPNEKYPFGKYTKGQTFTIGDLQVLRYAWISQEDAETILKEIGLATPFPITYSETGKLQVFVNNTTVKISSVTIDLDAISQKLQDIKALQDEIDKILTEVPAPTLQALQDEQKGEYTTHSSTLSSYQQTLASSQSTLQSNKDKLDKGVDQLDYDTFFDALEETLQTVSDLSDNAKTLKSDVDALYVKATELKKLCDARKATKAKIDLLKQDVKALATKIAQNKKDLNQVDPIVTGATSKLSQHEGKGLPLNTALEGIPSEKDAFSAIETELDATKAEIDDAVAKIDEGFTAETPLNEIELQIDDVTKKNSAAISKANTTNSQIATLLNKAKEIDSTVDEMIDVIDSLEVAAGELGNGDASLHENLDDIERFNTTVASLEVALVTKDDPDGASAAKLAALKASLAELKDKLTLKDTDFAMATRKGDSIDESISGFDVSTKAQIQSELTAFEATVNDLTTFVEGVDAETANLGDQLSEIESEISNLTDLYPANGGASADAGTKVTATIKKSDKPDIDFEITTTIDASESVISPRTLSSGQVLEDGSITQAQRVAYVSPAFLERPSDDVTKYEVKFAGQDKWGTSNVDTQGSKKGARFNMMLGANDPQNEEITIKWEKADGTVVSTVNVVFNFVGIVLEPYEVTATALTVDGTNLSIAFDKKIPNKMTVTVTVDELEAPVEFTSDGFTDKFVLSSEASEEESYTASKIESTFLVASGTPITYTPTGA